MELTITINLDNAAFEDAPLRECTRAIKQAFDGFPRVEVGAEKRIRDINGNAVGLVTVTP